MGLCADQEDLSFDGLSGPRPVITRLLGKPRRTDQYAAAAVLQEPMGLMEQHPAGSARKKYQ